MRNVFILLTILFPIAANAQYSDRVGLWTNLGISAGTSAVHSYDHISYASQEKPYYSTIADVGYMFGDNIGIFWGINCGSYGFSKRISTTDIDTSITGRQFMIELPVYLKLISSKRYHTGFFACTGLKPGIMLFHNTKLNASSDELYDKGYYRSFWLLFFSRFGISIPVKESEINIGPEISFQLTNLFKENFSSATNGHYLCLGLSISIDFPVEKWF